MGTSKQDRKYNIKKQVDVDEDAEPKVKVLINNHYYLDKRFYTWEEAEQYAAKYVQGKRMKYAVVMGG